MIDRGKQNNLFGTCSIIILLIVILNIFVLHNPAYSDINNHDKLQKTIVIDPGHGGDDKGVLGPDGTLEKSITLALAQIIQNGLGEEYQPILTRTDDYQLDIPERTSAANHAKADLFISIHSGGSNLHDAEGMTVYYYKSLSKNSQPPRLPEKESIHGNDLSRPWHNLQQNHIHASARMSNVLHLRLADHLRQKNITIRRVPLSVLSGADMPSVLIEIGYLTNPVEEKKLNNDAYLSDLAEGICKGISDFFSKKSDISFIDLHE